MKLRPLGRTGLEVSEVGDGASLRAVEHAIDAYLKIAPDAIAETALRHILSADAVSTVIAGMRSMRNVERNCATGDGLGLPREQVAKLHAHRWVRDFYR